MNFWRQPERISRKDKISNHVIRNSKSLQNSNLYHTKTKHLIWSGHIKRKADIWPKHVPEWMRPGRTKTGEPRFRWMKRIQDAIVERGVEEGR
jgi:hypothetical protein